LKLLQKRVSAAQPTLIHKLSRMPVVRSICIGQCGPDAWLGSLPAPAHLLLSWTWATGRSPLFLSLKHQCYQHSSLLNPNHSSYWEEN